MRVNFQPSRCEGTVTVPPSKSMAHRTLICAALAEGESIIENLAFSQDIEATIRGLCAFGARVERLGDSTVRVHGMGWPKAPAEPIDCGESGSTLRFFIPLAALVGQPVRFVGHGRLMERPQNVYEEIFAQKGVHFSHTAEEIVVDGTLPAGEYRVDGSVSSQFITGLLLALPLCEGESRIALTTPLQSAGYVDMTMETMARFGVRVETAPDGWRIPGGQRYRPHDETVEADWSQAAFLLAAGALGGEVVLSGLDPRSTQGDREALALFRRFGADIRETGEGLLCRRAPLHGIDIDASQIPDLVPILAVTAALAEGTTRITGAARLRLKESDRLAAVTHCLRLLGGRVEEHPDGLTIEGRSLLPGGAEVPGYNDHRIVMSMAVAALGCDKPVTITGAGCVQKSWPAFFTDFQQIGGNVHGVEYR